MSPRCLLALFVLLLAPVAASAEPHNSGAAIALAQPGIRVPFAVVPQPDSGALVLYQDTRNGANDIFAQRVDRRGRPTLGAGGKSVLSALSSTVINGWLPDGSGGCLIAWSQYRGATRQDVLVQRVLADGSLGYAASGLVVCNASFDQLYPQLAAGPAGSYYVVWTDTRANVPDQADVYVQRLTVAGAAQFAANGIPANTVAFRSYSYSSADVAADLAGGLLLAWNVFAPGGLRAQRITSAGALLFTATGVPLGDPTDYSANIAADGAGGLWAWSTRFSGGAYTPYAHHLTAAGASSFAPAGIAFHSGTANGFNLAIIRNASGGCFVMGQAFNSFGISNGHPFFRQELDAAGAPLRGADGEQLSYNNSLFALFESGAYVLLGLYDHEGGLPGRSLRIQRFSFDGTPAFPGNGVLLGREEPSSHETAITASASASGLVMEAHADGRYVRPANPYVYQIFGQALSSSGTPLWDDAENPVISAAGDAPADQGGRVRVAWDAGAGDSPATRMVRGYRGWRALGSAPAARLAALRPAVDEPFTVDSRRYLAHANLYWEMVAEAPATQLSSYALTLPTGQDSTAGGNADESFMIEAWDDSLHHWWCAALVAHSVDNLAPATPAPFTGQYAAGTAHLHWNRNAEPDLAGYRLYRGSSSGFVPGPTNLVGAPPDTGWTDPAGVPAVYKLSAVDVHGNESPVATLVPAGALGVGGEGPAALAFALASRNPSPGGATLRLSLPVAARVRVRIFDAAGREVRELADVERPAGEWTIAWDGADASGRAVASGLYLARLESAGRSFVLRLVLTR